MVTHNIGIANKYSTRIIELKDGEVYKDVKNSSNNKVSNYNDDYINNHYLSIKYILIYIYNLIKKKKGRFSISIICCVFLLFFLSLSFSSFVSLTISVSHLFLSSILPPPKTQKYIQLRTSYNKKPPPPSYQKRVDYSTLSPKYFTNLSLFFSTLNPHSLLILPAQA